MPSRQLAVFAIADEAIVTRPREHRWRGHGELAAALAAQTGTPVHPRDVVLGDFRADDHGTFARVGAPRGTVTRDTVERLLRRAFADHEPFEIHFGRP